MCFDYYLRVTPPLLAAPAATVFHSAIRAARASILSLGDHDDPGSPPDLLLAADTLAELPLRRGGFGHTPQPALSSSAFLASVRATQHDLLLGSRECQQALRRFTDHAYEDFASLLARPLDQYPDIVRHIPTTAVALAAGPDHSSNSAPKTTKKVQAALYAQ
jgi:hypothetical protein